MARYKRVYRIKKRKPFFKKIYFLISSLILLSCGLIFYLFFFSDFFQVNKVLISGQQRVSESDIFSFVNKFLERKLYNFSTKNIFLIDSQKIKEEILKNFSEIENIEIKKNFSGGLILKIKEREGVATFCQLEKCFLIDKKGIIFEEISNKNFQGAIIFNSVPFENLELGKKVIDEKILEKILEAKEKINELEIFIENIKIISDQKVSFKTQEGWEIFLDPQKEINWQIRKLEVVLKEGIPQEKRKDLEYIDLRFANFAYPKYKK